MCVYVCVWSVCWVCMHYREGNPVLSSFTLSSRWSPWQLLSSHLFHGGERTRLAPTFLCRSFLLKTAPCRRECPRVPTALPAGEHLSSSGPNTSLVDASGLEEGWVWGRGFAPELRSWAGDKLKGCSPVAGEKEFSRCHGKKISKGAHMGEA